MHDFISRSKLQRRSESNSAPIFQLNSFSGEIFLASDWDFFLNWEKRRIIWIGNRTYYRPLVIGRKDSVLIFGNHTFILEQAQ